MANYSFTINVAAPVEQVFDLWTNLDRLLEWLVGLKKVTDVTGPSDRVGTRYIAWFGRSGSPTVVLDAERPTHYRTRFGNWMLAGENDAIFDQMGVMTRVTQTFRIEGVVPALFARLFATGSYKGSFRGELKTFKSLCERQAQADVRKTPGDPP